jgi:hypothetical protein
MPASFWVTKWELGATEVAENFLTVPSEFLLLPGRVGWEAMSFVVSNIL